jgi:hypothetical protein
MVFPTAWAAAVVGVRVAKAPAIAVTTAKAKSGLARVNAGIDASPSWGHELSVMAGLFQP